MQIGADVWLCYKGPLLDRGAGEETERNQCLERCNARTVSLGLRGRKGKANLFRGYSMRCRSGLVLTPDGPLGKQYVSG